MTAYPNPRSKWDVHNPNSRAGQVFVTSFRKIYNPVGFRKGYNFPLFLIGVGGLMGFVLSRMMYLNWATFSAVSTLPSGVSTITAASCLYSLQEDILFTVSFPVGACTDLDQEAIPGEFYYYRAGRHKIGILLHLAGILPGGFLACLQFIPVIRHKAVLFHRINGYATILLLLIANAGAFMIADHSLGGSPDMQVWVGLLGTMITIGVVLAYVNIKRLQIDQHRAWMLRVWTWAAAIITLRLIMMAGQYVVVKYGYVYHISIRCSEVFYMYAHYGVPDEGNPTAMLYPSCLNPLDLTTGVPNPEITINPATNTGTFVSVSTIGEGPENSAALLRHLFIMAAWLATLIHAIVIEVYLWLTPAEHYRLRNVSYQRQVEAGMRPKGRLRDAGLTGATIGDAPEWWSVPREDFEEAQSMDMQTNIKRVVSEGRAEVGSDASVSN
ncbi:hypothetical protein LTR64_002063 [Lithohypha guttulata]|uniref:uncharacterized protein n=1 Tax=Lithohypha guttulata TaxID=1690604 RepID=UPI002DDFFBB4|nr:hypothetical protein LTR51_007920 [Lithohypha guttulata]